MESVEWGKLIAAAVLAAGSVVAFVKRAVLFGLAAAGAACYALAEAVKDF
jgi:hypothetical protein